MVMKFALGGALSILAAPALAGQTDLSALDGAVAEFTGSPIGAPGGAQMPVDKRLRLGECHAGMTLEWYGRARDTVLVRCPEPGGWRVFVPLVRQVQQSNQGEGVVTRGSRVTIRIEGAGFTLSRQGEALENGATGDWIRVKPADRQSDPIRARVLGPGAVGMQLP